jgi:hypothetical protein
MANQLTDSVGLLFLPQLTWGFFISNILYLCVEIIKKKYGCSNI